MIVQGTLESNVLRRQERKRLTEQLTQDGADGGPGAGTGHDGILGRGKTSVGLLVFILKGTMSR